MVIPPITPRMTTYQTETARRRGDGAVDVRRVSCTAVLTGGEAPRLPRRLRRPPGTARQARDAAAAASAAPPTASSASGRPT